MDHALLRSTDAGRENGELSDQATCGFLRLGSGLLSPPENIETRWRSCGTPLLESAHEIPVESDRTLLENTDSVLPGNIVLQLANKVNFLLENTAILQGNIVPLPVSTGFQVVQVLERGNVVSLRLENIEFLHLANIALFRQESTVGPLQLESIGWNHLQWKSGLKNLENSGFLLPESTGGLQVKIGARWFLLEQSGLLLPQLGKTGRALQAGGGNQLLHQRTGSLPLPENTLFLPFLPTRSYTGFVRSQERIVHLPRLQGDSGTVPCSLHRGPRWGSARTHRTGWRPSSSTQAQQALSLMPAPGNKQSFFVNLNGDYMSGYHALANLLSLYQNIDQSK